MSTEIAVDEDAHGNQDARRGRPPSGLPKTAAIPSRQTNKSSESLSRRDMTEQRGDASELESKPLDSESVLRELQQFEDVPDHVKGWVRGLGSLKPGTDVSMRLRTSALHEADQNTSSTLLSLLAKWTSSWFEKAERARKENRSSRSTNMKEQQDLDWLFRFTRDYLDLGHTGFSQQETSSLVDRVNDICQRTRKASDINNVINILYALCGCSDIPETSLEDTLAVLCASATNLQEPPDHLLDTFEKIAVSQNGPKALQILYGFIRVPTMTNSTKNLSHARGAARLLRRVVDAVNDQNIYILQLDDFAKSLNFAAQQKIFRFCSDILSACYSIMSTIRTSELLELDWKMLIRTLELCLETTPPGHQNDDGSGSALSPSSSTSEEDHEKQTKRHYKDRDMVARDIGLALGALWHLLSDEQKAVVSNYCLSFPRTMEIEQCTLALSYTERFLLWPPTAPHWASTFVKLLRCFVLDRNIPSSCRSVAVRLVTSTIRAIFTSLRQDSSADLIREKNDQLARQGFETLITQLATEEDKGVCQALASALGHLATLEENSQGGPDLAPEVIREFERIIMYTGPSSNIQEDRAFQATQSLVSIFLDGLHRNPNSALASYQTLLDAASFQCRSRRSRICAKQLLFRLRADEHGFIYVQSRVDVEYIAAALCRTRESLELFENEVPNHQRHSSSSTSLSTKSLSKDQLWSYPEELTSLSLVDETSSPNICIKAGEQCGETPALRLDLTSWLLNIIRCLQADNDWETYSYTIIHLGSQLANTTLFSNSMHTVVKLRQILCEQAVNASFREPPASTGLKKSDVALCIFNVLTPLIAYATMRAEAIQKGFGDDLVRAFLAGIGGAWEGTSRGCIHALSICSLEIPSSVASLYPNIIDKLSKNMTQSHLTMHILEFLSQIARLPEVHSNFNQDEITMIFGICIQFLEKTREQHQAAVASPPGRLGTPSRHSGLSFRRPPYRAAMLADVGVPQYASALAYHTMIFWFLSLKLEIRAKYVSWITPRLIWKNVKGEDSVDEQSQVFIDMMQRTAYSDMGETSPHPNFAEVQDGPITSSSWVVGLSVVTVETAGHTGLTQITKRQASGTTHATYQQLTTQLPSHHVPSHTEIRSPEFDEHGIVEILPSHILLQMMTTAAPTSVDDQPLPLPKETWVVRALESFDRIPTVDSHKIGVLYIDEGQDEEEQFLANQAGSLGYQRLLLGLGYTVSLEPPLHFNPQGLEFPRDGPATIAWRDRVTEIVYHAPTLMPNDLEEDPACVTKKSHVGNCWVNVIFNESGFPWKLDNLKSQFNYVNVVITPANRVSRRCPAIRQDASADPVDDLRKGTSGEVEGQPQFYKVQMQTREDLPNISPAADPKIVTAAQLPQLVRVLALNANVFSQAWYAKEHDPEFPSSWRTRLQQIKTLRDRLLARSGRYDTGGTAAGTSTFSPGMGPSGGRRTPVPREETTGIKQEGALVSQLDFGRWAP